MSEEKEVSRPISEPEPEPKPESEPEPEETYGERMDREYRKRCAK